MAANDCESINAIELMQPHVYRETVNLFDGWMAGDRSYGRRQVDHAELHEGAVKAALSFRGRREIGVAAMLEQAGARGKHPVKRQACLLQGDRPQKSDIQICALPGHQSVRGDIQSLDSIEGAELASWIRRELAFRFDPPRHHRLMIAVVQNKRWTVGKTG
jgi:hypothetical protein